MANKTVDRARKLACAHAQLISSARRLTEQPNNFTWRLQELCVAAVEYTQAVQNAARRDD